jgi:hypothetical protein
VGNIKVVHLLVTLREFLNRKNTLHSSPLLNPLSDSLLNDLLPPVDLRTYIQYDRVTLDCLRLFLFLAFYLMSGLLWNVHVVPLPHGARVNLFICLVEQFYN